MSTITDVKLVLTQKNFDALCHKFHIPEEVHPQLPTPDQTIHDKPEGKIGIYTRFFDFANYRLPLSSFFVTVLRYFRINFSQLSVIEAAKILLKIGTTASFGSTPLLVQLCSGGILERISKKRTKNKAKTTKPDSEWKRL
ncbi:hypothetical protein Tco_1049871 [Tanacetum coccineum]